ncbi:hypothetical protein Halha_1668 [Halobacteroides halobius DSM 5150]|uniref:Uncharacterized protein n=1 Tax=Halobacteroides halobius (strain ATCC 35273 / DSM 5150 / MD-1) TaxID=748449 RepID=L0K9B3_HALHC|nr:hypothetical protein [Halobacteroides halobius]AGB41606.1 hypothetical protein Halha_1668 [Halobacteroides halobius DSM 5150]
MNKLELIFGIMGLVYLMVMFLLIVKESLFIFTVLLIILVLLSKVVATRMINTENILAMTFLIVTFFMWQSNFFSLHSWWGATILRDLLPIVNISLLVYNLFIPLHLDPLEKKEKYYFSRALSYFIMIHYTLIYIEVLNYTPQYFYGAVGITIFEMISFIYFTSKYIFTSHYLESIIQINDKSNKI